MTKVDDTRHAVWMMLFMLVILTVLMAMPRLLGKDSRFARHHTHQDHPCFHWSAVK